MKRTVFCLILAVISWPLAAQAADVPSPDFRTAVRQELASSLADQSNLPARVLFGNFAVDHREFEY